MTEDMIARITESLGNSRKYRDINPETLERVAAYASARYPRLQDAEKAAKRKLHQIFSAYINPGDLEYISERVLMLGQKDSMDELRQKCTEVMMRHSSTRERLDYLDSFYGLVEEHVGRLSSVLDLACGLNPFAIPWMRLKEGASYIATDISRSVVDSLNLFMDGLDIDGRAYLEDIWSPSPHREADVVFLFKLLPCLEQQEKASGLRLIRSLNAKYVLVSFPLRSLGGRSCGMEEHYSALMKTIIDALGCESSSFSIPNEIVYVLSFS